MDRNLFGANSPGDLVAIDAVWGKDHSFLPHPLPPAWEFPVDLWPILNDASNLLHRLDGMGSTLPNPAILLKPLRVREAICSSEIEGTYANPREILLYEINPSEPSPEKEPTNDLREVDNYRKALHYFDQTELPLGLRLIRQLHQILMTGVRGGDQRPGEFRTLPVAIGTRGKFIPPPGNQVIELLGPLETFFHREKSLAHPLVDCFLAHYQFEAIHPFSDGNGRVGRLLLSLMIAEKCGLHQTWLHMSEYFEAHRQEYYDGLFRISTEGDWSSWIRYCLEGVVSQAELTLQRCNKLLLVKQSFNDRVQAINGSVRLQGIADTIFHGPLIQVTGIRDQLEIDYNTAKSDIEKLVEAGILEQLPDQYPKTYYAPEVFDIVYQGLD